jgi:flagellar protein FliS
MEANAYSAYFEGRILTAGPLELVQMLCNGATSAVVDARHCLDRADIPGRCGAINRAFDILCELQSSLDRERGGELSIRLDALYEYMEERLLQANIHQSREPLNEVLGLLSTLGEAWAELVKRENACESTGCAGELRPQNFDSAPTEYGTQTWAA